MQLLSNCYQRNLCEAGKPWFYWVFRFSYLIPTRSCKAWLNAFCMSDLASAIPVVWIIQRTWAIRWPVARVLPRRCLQGLISAVIGVFGTRLLYMRSVNSSTFSWLSCSAVQTLTYRLAHSITCTSRDAVCINGSYPLGGYGSFPYEFFWRISPVVRWINRSECWLIAIRRAMSAASRWVVVLTVALVLPALLTCHPPFGCGVTCWFFPAILITLLSDSRY